MGYLLSTASLNILNNSLCASILSFFTLSFIEDFRTSMSQVNFVSPYGSINIPVLFFYILNASFKAKYTWFPIENNNACALPSSSLCISSAIEIIFYV